MELSSLIPESFNIDRFFFTAEIRVSSTKSSAEFKAWYASCDFEFPKISSAVFPASVFDCYKNTGTSILASSSFE